MFKLCKLIKWYLRARITGYRLDCAHSLHAIGNLTSRPQ